MAEAATRIRLEIDATGAVRVLDQTGAAIRKIGQETGTSAQQAEAGLGKMLAQAQAAGKAAQQAAFQELSLLNQKIAIQRQTIAGTLSVADSSRKMAEADIFARTNNRELSSQLAATQQQFRANEQAILALGKNTQTTFGQLSQTFLSLQGILVGLGLAFGLRELVQYADTWRLLEGRLKLVTSSTEELTSVQNQLFAISQSTRTSFEGNVTLFTRLARSTGELGISQKAVLQVSQTLAQALQVSGATAQEASAGMIQLSQALASGRLQGDELRSVIEQLPRVGQAIAAGMGVPFGQLRALAAEGKISTQQIVEALLSQAAVIQKEFNAIPLTIGQALTVTGNAFLKFVGTIDEVMGSSSLLANVLVTLGENLDVVLISLGAFASTAVIANIEAITLAIKAATGAVIALNGVLLANPWVLMATAIALAAAGVAVLVKKIRELQTAMEETPSSFTPVEQAIANISKQMFDLERHIEFVRDNPLIFEGIQDETIARTEERLATLRDRLQELQAEWILQDDGTRGMTANLQALAAVVTEAEKQFKEFRKTTEEFRKDLTEQIAQLQIENRVIEEATAQGRSYEETLKLIAEERMRVKGAQEDQIEILRLEQDENERGLNILKEQQKAREESGKEREREAKALAQARQALREENAVLVAQHAILRQVAAGLLDYEEGMIRVAAATDAAKAKDDQLAEANAALAAENKNLEGSLSALIAKEKEWNQEIERQTQKVHAHIGELQDQTAAYLLQARELQRGIDLGLTWEQVQRNIANATIDAKERTGEWTAAQAAAARTAQAAQVSVEGLRAQLRGLGEDALLSTRDIANFAEKIAEGFLMGTRDLDRLVPDLFRALGTKAFKQFLVGKKDNFDIPLIGNINQLLGTPTGGILGAIFGAGGAAAAGNFVNNFGQGFGAGIPGIAQNTINANNVIWNNAGNVAGSIFGKSLFSSVSSWITTQFPQLGALFTKLGPLLTNPWTAAIALVVAGIPLIMSFFNQPGRIALEKGAANKFFEKIFDDIDFKIFKEPKVASGLLAFGPQIAAAAASLGALYAQSFGDKATQGTIVRFAGQFLANLEQMGVSSARAREMVLQLAQAMGFDLAQSLQDINALTTTWSSVQKRNLLSLGEFEEEIREARKNLQQYGDTSQLTAAELSKLALEHGNTGSKIVTLNELYAGAIALASEFNENLNAQALANQLLASEFTNTARETGLYNDAIAALAGRIDDGSLSIEEAIIQLNAFREQAGLTKLELQDFVLDPAQVVKAVQIITAALQGLQDFSANLTNLLSQGIDAAIADPAQYRQRFDDFFSATLRTAIAQAMIAGFTQGAALEQLRPFFVEFGQLIAGFATGALNQNTFGAQLKDLLRQFGPEIERIRVAFGAAGAAAVQFLDALGLLPGAANAAGRGFQQLIDVAQAAHNALIAGADVVVSALAQGLRESTAIAKGKAAFERFFFEVMRDAIIKKVLSDAMVDLLSGLDLTKPLDLTSQGFLDVKEKAGQVYENLIRILRALGFMPDAVDAVAESFDAAADAAGRIVDRIRDINRQIDALQNKRIQVQIDLAGALNQIGALSDLAFANLRINLAQGQLDQLFAQGGSSSPIGTRPLLGFSDAQLETALELVNDLQQATIDRYNAEVALINEAAQAQIDAINRELEATLAGIRAAFEAQREAVQERIDQLQKERQQTQELFRARLDALRDELRVAQSFQQVAESLQQTINQIVVGPSAVLQQPEQLAFLQRQAVLLRQQIAEAAPAARPELMQQLAANLQQQLQVGQEFLDPARFAELFQAVVTELEMMQRAAAQAGARAEDIQQQILDTQIAEKIALESIDAQIESQQDLLRQLSEQEQAAIVAAQAAAAERIAAVQEATRLKIEDLRAATVAELQRLAQLEDALLSEQIRRLEEQKNVLVRQLEKMVGVDQTRALLSDPNVGLVLNTQQINLSINAMKESMSLRLDTIIGELHELNENVTPAQHGLIQYGATSSHLILTHPREDIFVLPSRVGAQTARSERPAIMPVSVARALSSPAGGVRGEEGGHYTIDLSGLTINLQGAGYIAEDARKLLEAVIAKIEEQVSGRGRLRTAVQRAARGLS